MSQASQDGAPSNTGVKDLCLRIIIHPPWEAMEGRAGDPKGTGGAHKVQDGVAKVKAGDHQDKDGMTKEKDTKSQRELDSTNVTSVSRRSAKQYWGQGFMPPYYYPPSMGGYGGQGWRPQGHGWGPQGQGWYDQGYEEPGEGMMYIKRCGVRLVQKRYLL
ncbi:hypothetical protein Fcan01_14160 [Folsomia candida]|uniref:Uncharacterized protein n=1 Tax=Folsomia candida TaxID=158441 RepID=A0A226E105_FOLCA|nr:hypothetical protein Fcan01_14160 [Folsomia candida]